MAYLLSIAQDRRTKAQFTASNPVLLADQLAIETDSNVATTGDGTTAYLAIRGNTTLSGDDRRSADDVYAGQTLGDGRDEAGGGDALTSINLNVGPAIELRIPLDARWAQILNAGAPAAGEVEANSDADATAVTSITFHKLDAGTNDQSAWFTQMRVGGNLTVRMTNNDGTNASGSPCIYRITAVPTLASDRYTIAVAYVSGQFIGSLPNWYVSYAGNAPKIYRAILSQSGTDNPVAIELQNDIGTITWTRDNVGEYFATSAALYTTNKTFIAQPAGEQVGQHGDEASIRMRLNSTSQIQMNVFDGGGSAQDDLGRAWVEFIVYP